MIIYQIFNIGLLFRVFLTGVNIDFVTVCMLTNQPKSVISHKLRLLNILTLLFILV